MTQSVNHQVRRAIMVQLYTHASFSLPCLALLAISWSLLFHDYLPATEALGWLGLVFLLLLGRWWHRAIVKCGVWSRSGGIPV